MKRRISFSLSFVGIVLAGLLGSALARQSVPPIERATTLPSQRVYDWPELFPLEVGNEWVYSDGDGRFTVRVLRETLEANRMKYFEVSGYLPDDTAKVRKLRRGPLGQILEYNPGGEDFLWYRFGNYRGAWRFETGGDVTCITGSRVSIGDVGARVDVPAGTFERTLRLDFATRCADGGIVSEYFAGGVGLVERVLSTIAGPRIRPPGCRACGRLGIAGGILRHRGFAGPSSLLQQPHAADHRRMADGSGQGWWCATIPNGRWSLRSPPPSGLISSCAMPSARRSCAGRRARIPSGDRSGKTAQGVPQLFGGHCAQEPRWQAAACGLVHADRLPDNPGFRVRLPGMTGTVIFEIRDIH